MATFAPASSCSRIGAAAASSNLVFSPCGRIAMSDDLQRLQPRAVFAGVFFRQLPAAFAAPSPARLVRRDGATVPAHRGWEQRR